MQFLILLSEYLVQENILHKYSVLQTTIHGKHTFEKKRRKKGSVWLI